jgi:carbamoyltransferase
VNNKIKFREPFRPFAPSVLSEATGKYFELPGGDCSLPMRFMHVVLPVKSEHLERVPAVSHMGTARVQAVHEDTNPLFHDLIRQFGDAAGVPMVLNTSFNVRGEPIVNTPHNALDTFANSGIDTLVLGNYVIDKR